MLAKVLGTTVYRQFGTSATSKKSFTLSFIISDINKSDDIVTETYSSARDFRDSFPGFRFTNPNTDRTFAPSTLPGVVDPTVVYIAKHPCLTPRLQDTQISDKVFEDKACKALEHYLNKTLIVSRRRPDDDKRRDGWRILTGERDIAEWEGIWQSRDGHVFFLEAKHFMEMVRFRFTILILSILIMYTQNKVGEVNDKLRRSLDFLGIDRSKASVYIAGNHWLNERVIREARMTYGFGVLTCNGLDLDIQEPNTAS
jgi:hypothetical protein